jgi:hypothetical protein
MPQKSPRDVPRTVHTRVSRTETTLRTTVPQVVGLLLDLRVGDRLAWEFDPARPGRVVLTKAPPEPPAPPSARRGNRR